MEQQLVMEVIGKTFRDGQFDELKQVLHPGAVYRSEYDGCTVSGAHRILTNMMRMYHDLDARNSYTYEVVHKNSVLYPTEKNLEWDAPEGTYFCDYVLILRQYIPKYPVAVVIGLMTNDGQLAGIYLDRNTDIFALDFYCAGDEPDFSDDLPSSVIPMRGKDRFVEAVTSWEQGQRWEKSEPEDGLYIWRQANAFTEWWLPQKGYSVTSSAVFADCIGYRCMRGGHEYTVFMYADGKRRTSHFGGDFCAHLATLPFAENSTVLVLYLKVQRYREENTMRYRVSNDGGLKYSEPDLWQLKEVNERYILVRYPGRETMDRMRQWMYAFNRESMDVYDSMLACDYVSIEGIPSYSGVFTGEEFYHVLRQLHQEYGDMKAGYVRDNAVGYTEVPYIEGVGFFEWDNYNDTDRMCEFFCRPFTHGEIPLAEFVYEGMREEEELSDHIPTLVAAEPLPPQERDRFAVKLYFSDDTCRKWVLPVGEETEQDKGDMFGSHRWTEDIWDSLRVTPARQCPLGDPDGGPGIVWDNGFFVSGMQCWLESEVYSERVLMDEVVYEDEQYRLRKLWQWDARAVSYSWEAGMLQVWLGTDIPGEYGQSVAMSPDGRRMSRMAFDEFDSDEFDSGRALVRVDGEGYGFIDKTMNIAIPLQYDEAEPFIGSVAKVKRDGRTFFINPDGEEIPPKGAVDWSKYREVREYVEGMCCVSAWDMGGARLADYTDYEDIVGTSDGVWGFINEAGEEVVRPQYIYAFDFENGLAWVAKGEWFVSPKWDTESKNKFYWSEATQELNELWGAIDAQGNEVIPTIFDGRRWFEERSDIFPVRYGGWKNGHWGIIDNRGNWVVEPIFADIGYEVWGDLVVFYDREPDRVHEDPLQGVYDAAAKKVVLEAQFEDITFGHNGDIIARVFDEKLRRRIERVFDKNGKERFPSVYSGVCPLGKFYEVSIGDRHGLVDRDGHVVLPCEYHTDQYGIQCKQRRVYFTNDEGLMGVNDFDGNVIIPAMYEDITYRAKALLTVTVKGMKQGLITHDGREVLPAVYESIHWYRWDDDKQDYILTHGENGYIMYRLERRGNAAEEHA